VENHAREDYNPTWHNLLRDVHDVDKRLTIIESAHISQAKALDELKLDAKESTRTLNEVRDAVVGWKSSIASIVFMGGAVAAVIFFVLGKVWQ
jgi:hypothetical protein